MTSEGEDWDDEIVALTQQLLDAIASADWQAYQTLCDPRLSAFEPEARGHLVQGMAFHQTYFEARAYGSVKSTISSPMVWKLSDEAAVIAYVRLNQTTHPDGRVESSACEETRVWQRRDGHWKHLHFHRSAPS